MARTIILYGLALAIAATLLQWLDYRHAVRAFSTELYIALLAIGFVSLGIWVGKCLTPRAIRPDFIRNDAAARAIGLTAREAEILALLASGGSNKELARSLGISPNTVKTHVARVYDKLGVSRRIEAIEKARFLALIA
ncbi:response regulator transcription factor [Sphingomonas sp. 28-63-12]|uniref:response regulator transcription factor n=1 Tax=Sphingomonas sp. 28-63-12 TaxID=1970434 RepID=UPI000BD7EA5D|nr:MAG: helix-turn-helix transcriptional regulator [Sphingomonas sp. 28-63-12]